MQSTYQQPDATGHFGNYGGTFASETLTHAINELRDAYAKYKDCLLYTSPSPRDLSTSRMPSSA